MINFKNVNYNIGQYKIIKDFSIQINKGDFVAIVGENGAGKSTLSKLMAGLIKPSSGDILIDSNNTKKMKASALAKSVSYLFQNPDRQICKNTVKEELLFGLDILAFPQEEKEKRLAEIQEKFNFDLDAQPFALSRGQKQMLAFASTLIMKPQLLILDEPTTGLDYNECMKMMQFVTKLNAQGCTVVMISHDMEVVDDFAKNVLVLSGGQKLAFGETHEIMRNEKILKEASVLPSQITALSLMLGENYKHCTTAKELADEIERGCK